MKKIMGLAAVVLFCIGTANAQDFRIGGKVGANLDKVTGKAFDEEYDLGYHVGVFAEADLNKQWGIQPEVLWNQINTKRASGTNAVFNNCAKLHR